MQGINPPFTLEELRETENGEMDRGFGRFEKDLYGVHEMLDGKRRARNWDPRIAEAVYGGLEPEVTDLLNWNGTLTGLDIFLESCLGRTIDRFRCARICVRSAEESCISKD